MSSKVVTWHVCADVQDTKPARGVKLGAGLISLWIKKDYGCRTLRLLYQGLSQPSDNRRSFHIAWAGGPNHGGVLPHVRSRLDAKTPITTRDLLGEDKLMGVLGFPQVFYDRRASMVIDFITGFTHV